MNYDVYSDLVIHSAFEREVIKNPNQIALIYKEQQVSYQQLNARANFLANYLVKQGIEHGDFIGISMSRSIEVIVAKLAILKCGAAYLPLDKVNPDARNKRCLEEAKARLILADNDCVGLKTDGIEIITTSNNSVLFNSEQEENLAIEVDTDDKAYVMFTSGSTGNPKGVVVPHRAVIRLVNGANYVEFNPSDKIMQFSSLSFDASTFEIWGALLNGATLVLYSGETFDPNLFSRELKDNQVATLFITTALFHILATRFIDVLAPLKNLLTGGDVLYPEIVNKVADHYPELNLIICYGPTENTSFTTTFLVTNENRPEDNVPIGKAISGTDVHILGDDLKAVAIGEVGELFTSGSGVALGYLNRERSISDFFINNDIATGLIYRTGDLVKMNSSGDIEFVGRSDNQVKIRGFRASLEEIQNGIVRVEQVTDAVVFLDKFENGDQLLIAFVKLVDGLELNAKELKTLFAKELPDYMVPDRIYINVEFPINKNGKVCKKSIRESIA
ncbi:amino acid adenylation domain-containing protein [Aliikangiella sp. IMCC44359]|uniref:amino acid adenylation domain-containing protein n=1 Tax=Aliikangiella sp. IMCC44359 TaxID=3459125 RepID=UPI00403B1113